MTARKGVFIGAYVPQGLKESLQRQARSEHRTLSQQITRILEMHITNGLRRRRTDSPSSEDARPMPETLPELLAQDEQQTAELHAPPLAQNS